jgi:hypothetical protein
MQRRARGSRDRRDVLASEAAILVASDAGDGLAVESVILRAVPCS